MVSLSADRLPEDSIAAWIDLGRPLPLHRGRRALRDAGLGRPGVV